MINADNFFDLTALKKGAIEHVESPKNIRRPEGIKSRSKGVSIPRLCEITPTKPHIAGAK